MAATRTGALGQGEKGADVPVYEAGEVFAKRMDANDPLRSFRDEFIFPTQPNGEPVIYFTGNSLGLQPKSVRRHVDAALDSWAELGVNGHFRGKHPWTRYHELLTDPTARLVGALPVEVVTMNTLTVNLHLMMASFYRPEGERRKILVEEGAFPSDEYAIQSQARLHRRDPDDVVMRLAPRPGEATLRTEDIVSTIERHGSEIALVLLGNVNYLTGQAFDMKTISRVAHENGCHVGFDCAHAAGNIEMNLHDAGPDFAVWCTYKYLNGGPGNLGGVFIHERHANRPELLRLSGWWGHDKSTRFLMGRDFHPIPGAEGWQLSNPPILQLAALRASLELFDRATMPAIRQKSVLLTGYLEWLIDRLPEGFVECSTPRDPNQRGAQLSLRFLNDPRGLLERLEEAGVVCDFREPDVIRAAPAPLYNSFEDVYRFGQVLEAFAS